MITRMLEGGVPFAVVSAIMGWSPSNSMLMLKKYGHIGQKAFTDAVALVNGDSNRDPGKKPPAKAENITKENGSKESKEPKEDKDAKGKETA